MLRTSEVSIVNSAENPPELSVIVTIVVAGVTLERCLQALAEQSTPPTMEVLIPYDHLSLHVEAFIDQFPSFLFINLGKILGELIPKNALEEPKFFDAGTSI